MSNSAVTRSVFHAIRYSDVLAQRWLWRGAPLSWAGRVAISFQEVRFDELLPASSLRDPEVILSWRGMLLAHRTIPPLVVSRTYDGALYVHDGNHRLAAMCTCFYDNLSELLVRVAVVQPRIGYRFRYRWFGCYGTYVLEPAEKLLDPSTEKEKHCAGWAMSPRQRISRGERCMSR